MITIPSSTKQYTQPNNSDNEGLLFSTFNCDFQSNEGLLRLAHRLLLNTSTADQSTLVSYPVAFKTFDDGTGSKIYTAAGTNASNGYVFQGTSDPTGAFTQMAFGSGGGAGAPQGIDSQISDLEVFNGELYVTPDGSNAYYYNASQTWATLATGSSANGYPRPLCNFPALGRLYFAINGYQVVSSDTSHAVASAGSANTCSIDTIKNRQVITFIRAGADRLWIGTVNILGGRGHVYEWDGTSTQFQTDHVLESSGALSCVINNDVPEIIDANGNFLIYNGGNFVPKTGFYKKNRKPFYNAASKVNNRFIHPNGMAIIDGETHVLVDLTNNDGANHTGTQEYCNPSGIWEYDDKLMDLKHKYSFGLSKSGGAITDYGQFRIAGAGAISELIMNKDYTYNTNNGQFICGATYYTDATNTLSGIFYDDTNDTLQKGGYFVTSKISADDGSVYHLPSVQNMWQNLYTLFRKFLNSTDKILVKYRVVNNPHFEVIATWTSTSTFTTTTNLLGLEGYEVEIIQGIGGGYTAQITKIDVTGGVYTVTMDDTFTGATGTSKARIMNFKKISTITPSSSATYDQAGVGDLSNWIQVKTCMLFTGQDEIEKQIIINENANPAN